LRFGITAGEPVTQPIYTPRVHPHQFFPTGGVTAQAPFDERAIQIQAVPSRFRATAEHVSTPYTRTGGSGSQKRSGHGSGCHSLPRNLSSSACLSWPAELGAQPQVSVRGCIWASTTSNE